MIEEHLATPGKFSVCIREVQKDLSQSSKRLLEIKLADFGLGEADGFKIYKEQIQTPGDGLIIFKGMNDFTAESIKSLEGYDCAWWEEAQSASARSLNMLKPTLRKAGSELWFSWNARLKSDPVDVMMRGPEIPTGAAVVKANWRDNPWLTEELEQERLDCLRMQPDQYDHIWEGGYLSVASGAYYAKQLADARSSGRIGNVARDPLMPIRAVWDIGVRDATAIWICQFIGREIRVLDYYEAVNQQLATHLDWLRRNNYGDAICILPHDGSHQDAVTAIRFEDHIRQAGFKVQTVPNQGKGAAMKRVEIARRLFPMIWFNEKTTEPGRDALGWYHERKDEQRQIGLGPEHDWSSHGADAFGLMCVAYDEPHEKRKEARPRAVAGGWMS